ncbi:MAG: MBL fold metallo-hydrolase [Candidatus Thorarchaeota archaeon]
MTHRIITVETGKINDYLHHIDLKEFGTRRILSSFIGEFDNFSVILDSGSSLEVKRLIKYAKKNQIPFSSFKYLITTHHHFDHNGGMWKLYEFMKKHNPNVKIITNQKTKELLNDYEYHLNRAKSTFGNNIGEMKPIEKSAFNIIEPTINFSSSLNSIEFIDTFSLNGEEIKLSILKTPGHTPDHQCPLFIKDGEIDFIDFGEAVGTLYHSTKLLTMPTSMPVYFKYIEYMETLEKLKKLRPVKAGFGHFGVVSGKANVREIVFEHESFMKEYRAKIIKYYEQKPETRYVVEKILPFLVHRTDLMGGDNPVLRNIILAIVYGMMVDLGYRKI